MWPVFGGRSGACRVLVVMYEGKTKLGRPKSRCDDYFKMDL